MPSDAPDTRWSWKRPRTWFALPFEILQGVIAYGVIIAFQKIAKLFVWLSLGTANHVYWPIVVAKRIVCGFPRWQSIDLEIGKQPVRPADIARAESDPELMKIEACSCSNPACKMNGKQIFVPKGIYIPMGAALEAVKPLAVGDVRDKPDDPASPNSST